MIFHLENQKESGNKLLAVIELSHVAECKLHTHIAYTDVNCISVHHQ